MNRDRAGIYLCRSGQGRGVAIRMPLTNFSWALEFHVEDPDGSVLRFGSEPRAEAGG